MITEVLPKVDLSKAVSNKGDRSRFLRVMERALRGESITVGFIGGSITQGFSSSSHDKCYAHLVYEWFAESFPKSEVRYVNAGIGATDSQFGCARAESDLLSYEPDICFVEFSVNDSSTEHYHETYEGLVRKILLSGSLRALMLIHNIRYDDGSNAQLMHSKVARRYDVPAVSMRDVIYPSLEKGEFDNRLITEDDLHPNDTGHALVASVIISVLEDIKRELTEGMGAASVDTAGKEFPKPETRNAYEDSVRYRNDDCEGVLADSKGFAADHLPQEVITDIFRKGWMASEKGSFITFKVKASCIALQFRRTISRPAPAALVSIDDDRDNRVMLDADFDEDWGDKLELVTVLEHGENREHTVKIELTETHPDDKLPFYLVSMIASGNN